MPRPLYVLLCALAAAAAAPGTVAAAPDPATWTPPGDAAVLLTELGRGLEISYVIGADVQGLTQIAVPEASPADTFKLAALQTGMDFVTVGPVLVARLKERAAPILHGPVQQLREAGLATVTLDFHSGAPQRQIIRWIGAQLGREVRLHPRIRGHLSGRFSHAGAADTLDALCAAAALRWGVGRHAILLAPVGDYDEFFQEMWIDGRT